MSPPAAAGTPPTSGGSPFSAAADRLRESARWLVVTFGAVIAVVFAGISLSRFDQLDPARQAPQFWVAVVGALLALIGTLLALALAMGLAAASTVSVADVLAAPGAPGAVSDSVRDTLTKDPLLAPWDGDLAAFWAQVRAARVDFDNELRLWREDEAVDAAAQLKDRAAVRAEWYDRVQASVLATASYLRLSERFSRTRWFLCGALLLAAGGAMAFVWATGASATRHLPEPVEAGTWRVADDDRARVTAAMGKDCEADLDAVPVLVLDGVEGETREVVTVPEKDCAPVRLVVPAKDVSAR